MATIKGQNLRILLAGEDDGAVKCVAAATNCNAHVALELAEDTTKDTDDDWVSYMPVGLSWDVQVDSLLLDGADENAKQTERLVVGNIYVIEFSRTEVASGSQNRRAMDSGINMVGYAILSDLQITSNNQEIAQATARFTGTGDLSFAPVKIQNWVLTRSQVTSFGGIASVSVQDIPYAVAIGKDENHNVNYIFPLTHDKKATIVGAELSVVDYLEDYIVLDETLFNEIVSAASAVGYQGGTYPGDVYDFPAEQVTGIIGEEYLGVLNS